MVRNAGTTNYSMADIDRMLCLVEKVLPLGKDEWERLAASFNASKPRGAPEREFESLRRKFKQLYSTRKPTGVATMPPHIQRAKEAKQAIDDKANVVELDDDADEDQPIAPDFSSEPEPDHTFYEPGDAEFVHAAAERSGAGSVHSEATGTDMSVDGGAAEPIRGAFQDLLSSPLVSEGLDAGGVTPRPAPPRAASTTRRTGSGSRATASEIDTSANAQRRLDRRHDDRSRDAVESAKYPELSSRSNRLGGGDLAAFRDSTGAKRALEEDKDTQEASFAKAKRVRAMKATTALKSQLDGLENAANNTRGSILETILLLREENERKAEARREEEEQRRRNDLAAMENRRLAERAEAEERRRTEKQEMEERARRDREEARARTQELLMLIGALTKKS
ncbi:hypothetical protein F442_20518 [Phytophthora nicotianae P10297]|uniref:DUF6818 domain-containing protein n=1 Tax=Phytophthora nicotianae P10297 TaxID=1317064 RepID=W2Y5X7_PHYNI|nr:hypothetical protein F442_20518 [Phytophthora nicotianae P10297]